MSVFPALRQDGRANPLSKDFDPTFDVFSDEAIGPRPSRHVLADRRQDADNAHLSTTDDRAGDVPAHILAGEAPRGALRSSSRRAQ